MHTSDGAELVVVSDSDSDAQAAAIKARRIAVGLGKSRGFAVSEAKRLQMKPPVTLDAIKSAEAGTAKDATYLNLRRFYDRYEQEIGEDDERDDFSQLVTVKITGNFGVSATVQGPVGDREEIQELATALIRELRAETE